MTLPSEAIQRQLLASDPSGSAWVSANAGSGKTRVLTDRVIRLLLAGAPPERILCLTYTRAAAAEMQNRLYARLGGWTMMPDTALAAELAPFSEDGGPPDLRAARRLFARAVEAPGGLKILTIHAFAASLLRRFPLEAGVSPAFREIDERAQRLMREALADEFAAGERSEETRRLAGYLDGTGWDGLLADMALRRTGFGTGRGIDDWRRRMGLPAGFDEPALLASVFTGGEDGLLSTLIPALGTGGATDVEAAAALRQLRPFLPSARLLEGLEDLFLTKSTSKVPFSAKTHPPTKDVRRQLGAVGADLDALIRRVEAARPRRIALAAARRQAALYAFAEPFLAAYRDRKVAAGVLDFDDQILGARSLLSRPGVAEWVLFRLDGGIDHLLLDEAQDTSPEQWDIVRLIAEEFTEAASARSDALRTLFVVGDVKQSIYSFQGAEPANFERMADHFASRHARVGRPFVRGSLPYSFRSAPAILRIVDRTFADPDRAACLGGPPEHIAIFEDLPGRVDVWPLVPKAAQPEETPWYDPVDRVAEQHEHRELARMIAAEIARMCREETVPLPGRHGTGVTRRRVGPGDVLILVQRRSLLFTEIIRACKAAGLPIAGADRLKLPAELAVRDLVALLSFLATPEDSLSLAAALKSPLFGWSEDRLFRLAHGRGERHLWEALRARAEAERDTVDLLTELRNDADFLRPFDLIDRILIRHDGRRRLLARLGVEAEDGLDALLSAAIAYEDNAIPSLTGFLGYFQQDEVEVKRQVGRDSGMIRVMTVHSAKGLEAPVVILPDTGRAGQDRSILIGSEEGDVLWRMAASDAPDVVADAIARRARRLAEERMRLLYVAMTRAESWLVVAGSGEPGAAAKGDWHAILTEVMTEAGARPVETPAGPGMRHDAGADWVAPPLVAPKPAEVQRADLPDWAFRRPAEPGRAPAMRSPSDLGGEKVIGGAPGGTVPALDEAAATKRGRQLHLLFEHLPAADRATWPGLAEQVLTGGADAATPEEAGRLLAEALRVLEDPRLADLFAPDGLAEVGVADTLPGLGPLTGTIDRLIVRADHVRAIDYKTNAVVPARPEEVPEGILRQMGAYRAVLMRLYPGRYVETAILWTAEPLLMPLPPDLVDAALIRARGG